MNIDTTTTEKPKTIENNNIVATEKPVTTETKQPPTVNRGLLLATVLVVLAGAGYFFLFPVNKVVEAESVQTAGIVDVDVKTLTGGEQLIVARISNNTLIGVVNNDWTTVEIEKKRQNLQSLLKQGNEKQFKSILLFNSHGDIVGKATADEITAR